MPGTPSSPGPDPFPTCVRIVGQQAERPRLFPAALRGVSDLEAACLSQERLLDCVAAPPRTPVLSICLEHSCGPGADGRAEGRLDSCFSPPFVTADLW